MALSKHESGREISNLARIARIIYSPCTDILRSVLKSKRNLSDLRKEVYYYRRETFQHQFFFFHFQHIISKSDENYSGFDIPLLYVSLRFFCGIPSHGNKWGNFPDEKDRSLSANIDRIYYIHKIYRQFPIDDLNDSIFEQKWKSVSQTVKELEEHLGTGTKHQDTLKSLKICSMEKDVKRVFIERLWAQGQNNWVDHFLQDVGILEVIDSDGSESGYMDLSGSVEQVKLLESESEDEDIADKPQGRTEPIASKELAELFNSFNLEFPEDPLKESFARRILQEYSTDFVSLINSLSTGVVLTKNEYASNKAMLFEIDIVYERGQFRVVNKDTFLFAPPFFPADFSPTRIILITSKFLPVVKAKLMVYKKYKHAIIENKIFLQHEYEEFDNVAKLVAQEHLMSFCTFIESVINSFTVNMYKIISAQGNKPMAGKQIRELCLKAFEGSGQKPLGCKAMERDWEYMVVNEIEGRLFGGKKFISTDAWDGIWNICRKTVEDLEVVLSRLEAFRTQVLPIDQDKHIEEWHKSEFYGDIPELRNNPSIINFIAGNKADKKHTVKVYLHGDNKEAEDFIKNCCNISKHVFFEIVDVDQKKKASTEDMERNILEDKAPDVDDSTRMALRKIIQKYGDSIYARYSNVVGIQIGKVRRVRDLIKEQPCIILYCLDKSIIPFGESALPEFIAGWPCDVREECFTFGTCPRECTATNQNLPEAGCSIGICSTNSSGSAGFMYKSINYGSGFLTASHVAVECLKELYLRNTPLSNNSLELKSIVHPSYEDSNTDNQIGDVVESYFGNFELSGTLLTGLDIAVVKNNFEKREDYEALPIFDINKATYPEKVAKTGRTTGLRYGYLKKDRMESCLVKFPSIKDMYFNLCDLLIVEDIDEMNPFFRRGDSGSGVVVLRENTPDQALGIAIACSTDNPKTKTLVCKITEILSKLNLDLVRYRPRKMKGKPEETEN